MVLPTLRAVREAFAEWLSLAGGCESRLDSNAFGRVRKMTRPLAEAYEKPGNHHGLELAGTSPHNA
jgi:hypothetical protein